MMAMRAGLAVASAAFLAVAGCASRTATASRSSGVSAISSPITGSLCVEPHPAAPKAVTPAIPNVAADGGLTSTWSLDGGQATVGSAGSAHPRVDRQQALCTLLAASEINGYEVLQDDTGFSLVLGKVSIADQLLATPEAAATDVGAQSPPPLRSFHSRLAWVGVVDPPVRSSCGFDGFASSTPSPVQVPYQLLVLDADTGADGVVYEARTYSPCIGSPSFGPEVAPLMVNVSVPWRLISRDPGGMFGTIAVTVRTCDSYGDGANTSSLQVGLLEYDVARPIDACGPSKEASQTLRGPTVSDPLPPTLTHAALGYRDTEPDSAPAASVSPTALLCEESLRDGEVMAATFPTTIGDLLSSRAGPPPGHMLVTDDATKFAASALAAWCEVKTAAGYSIDIVGPNGVHLSNDIFTSTTFVDLANGPPALP